jgi:Protein of unknown function (DUF2849)
MALQMLTANRLTDGTVVFRAADGRWVEQVAEGHVVEEAAAPALLKEGEAAVARAEVVGPYLIDVALADGRPVPLRYRERIRADGPSVGKQARAS